jgi:hypothetical protein
MLLFAQVPCTGYHQRSLAARRPGLARQGVQTRLRVPPRRARQRLPHKVAKRTSACVSCCCHCLMRARRSKGTIVLLEPEVGVERGVEVVQGGVNTLAEANNQIH